MKSVALAVLLTLSFACSYAQDATALIQEGISFHDKGDFAKAIELYKKAEAIDPDNGIIAYEMAFSYHAMRAYPEALAAADKAITLSTGQTKLMAMIVRGSVQDDSGNPDQALKTYETAMAIFPGQYLLLFNYGVTLAKLERYKDAENAYINALQLNFSHPGSHLQLARLKKLTGHDALAAMGLYFFLLIENESPRSVAASADLLDWMYPPRDTTNRTISISLQKGPANDRENSAELFFKLLGPVSGDLDKKTERSQQEKFVADTQGYFSVLSELRSNGKSKKKKKKDAAFDPWWDGYVPLFANINKAGHTEAFCYHIMKSVGSPDVETWLAANYTRSDEFYAWLRAQ